jgi:hypothetical protein
MKMKVLNLMVSNNAGDSGSTRVFELWRNARVLDKRTDLLCAENFHQGVGPCSSLSRTQILEEFGVRRNLFDGIKERDIDFYLLEDL